MYKIAFAFIFFITSTVSALTIPMNEFFNFVESGQNDFMSPKFTNAACLQKEPGVGGFDAKKCAAEICHGGFNMPELGSDDFNQVVACVSGGDNRIIAEKICSGTGFEEYLPKIEKVAMKLKEFYGTELKLTGYRIKAAIDFLEKGHNLSSSFDNFNTNIGDLMAFVVENKDLFEIKLKGNKGFQFKIISKRKARSRLGKYFNLNNSEKKSALKAIESLYSDSNSLLALEILGPEFVIKDFMEKQPEGVSPIDALRAVKFKAVEHFKDVLGTGTIDPEFIQGSEEEASIDLNTILQDALLLNSLKKGLSKKDFRRLSKPNFTKTGFYNRERFDRDWSQPHKDLYRSTLSYLKELQKIYVGDAETVKPFDLYPHVSAILQGIETLPSDKTKEDVKKKVPEFIDGFFKKFGEIFSKRSTSIIQSKMNKLHIKFPDSKNQYLEKVEKWLAHKQSLADSSLKLLRDSKNIQAPSYFGRQYLQKLLSGQSEIGGLNELAPLVGVNPIPDLYIGTYNGIKMGPYAVKEFDGPGKQVLAHELGHHIGHFMESHPLSQDTTYTFARVRQCLATTHNEVKSEDQMEVRSLGKKKYLWKENLYTEEDFADWIAAKTSDKNMACFFIQNEFLDQGIEGLLVNPNINDTHSSGFYRLLNIEMQQRGKLPKSCKNDVIKTCPTSN